MGTKSCLIESAIIQIFLIIFLYISDWVSHKKKRQPDIHWKYNIWTYSLFLMCVFFFFRTCVLPEGLAKELPEIVKIPKCLDLIDCTMVLPISTCEIDAKTTQRHSNTSATCFEEFVNSNPYGLGFRAYVL